MSEIYSVGPLTAGCGMNITVWSYVDQLSVSVICDDRTVDDPHKVADAMIVGFDEIRYAAVVVSDRPPVASAMAPARSLASHPRHL